jgi:calmodulin
MADEELQEKVKAVCEEFNVDDDLLQEMKDAFKLFDKDQSGSIDSTELGMVLRSLGQNPTETDIQEMITTADVSGDNKIQFDEFLRITLPKRDPNPEETLKECFKMFDKDNNGVVSREELRGILVATLAENCTEKDVDEMMDMADTNKDGLIQYQEFVHAMCSK